MFHYQTVPTNTLELLKLISPRLSELGFHLADGTALAFRLGHRVSVDLDFFNNDQFSGSQIVGEIDTPSNCPSKVTNQTEGSVALVNQETKLEFLSYDYQRLGSIDQIDGVSLLSLADNAVMKLSAIVGRGAKKDFADIASLLTTIDLSQMPDWNCRKYPNSDSFVVMKSLTGFEDAEAEPDPIFLNQQSWAEIKQTILSAVS